MKKYFEKCLLNYIDDRKKILSFAELSFPIVALYFSERSNIYSFLR